MRQIGPHEYEIPRIVLDEEQTRRLELLMRTPSPDAARAIEQAVTRARARVSDAPLSELLR